MSQVRNSIHFPNHGWFTILDKRGYLHFESDHTKDAMEEWINSDDMLMHDVLRDAVLDKRWEAFGLWLTLRSIEDVEC